MVCDMNTLTGIIDAIRTPQITSLAPSLKKRSLLTRRQIATINSPTGIMMRNAATIISFSRYFSRNTAHRMITEYLLRSASLSAIGVPISPGTSVMAADAAIATADISMTVAFFSSRYCTLGRTNLSAENALYNTVNDSTATRSSATATIILLALLLISFSLHCITPAPLPDKRIVHRKGLQCKPLHKNHTFGGEGRFFSTEKLWTTGANDGIMS